MKLIPSFDTLSKCESNISSLSWKFGGTLASRMAEGAMGAAATAGAEATMCLWLTSSITLRNKRHLFAAHYCFYWNVLLLTK